MIKKAEEPTKRQKKIMTEISSGKHKTARAAIAAATGRKPAKILNREIERTIRSVHDSYLKALARAGATDRKSARVISEAMDAQAYTMTGMPYANHKVRLNANEQYLKVKRLMEPEGDGKDRLPPQIVVNVVTVTPAQDADNLQAPRFAVPDIS